MVTKESNIKVCRTSRRNLEWVLVWPCTREELKPGKSYYIKIATFCFTTGIIFSSVLTHLVVSVKDRLDIPLSENIAMVISLSGIYYIVFTFIYQRLNVSKLLQDLSDFRHFGKPSNFENEESLLSMLSNSIFVYSVFGTTVYTLVKYLKKSECEEVNKEKNLDENCGFIVSLWIPFDIDYSVIYYTVFVYVFVFGQLFGKPSLLITSCAFEMTRHIILRIKHLNAMVQHCFDVENYYISKSRLKQCIKYHNNILGLATRLDACFSNTMFAHLTITSTACACLEKQFIEDDKLCAGLHMLGWVLTLLLACVAGQLLFDASESISQAIWISKWYKTDVRLRKDIHFFLMRSQRNLYISAGPFGTLSYSLFVSVMKMSYSVLCLLTS